MNKKEFNNKLYTKALISSIDEDFVGIVDIYEEIDKIADLFIDFKINDKMFDDISNGYLLTKEEIFFACTKTLRYQTFKEDDFNSFRMISSYNREMKYKDSIPPKIFFKIIYPTLPNYSILETRDANFTKNDDNITTNIRVNQKKYYGTDLTHHFYSANKNFKMVRDYDLTDKYLYVKMEEMNITEDATIKKQEGMEVRRCKFNPDNVYGVYYGENNIYFITNHGKENPFGTIGHNEMISIGEEDYFRLCQNEIESNKVLFNIKRKRI